MMRKGLGKGKGQGYKNLIPVHDSVVHSRSRRGIKQPQQIGNIPQWRPLYRTWRNHVNFNDFSKSKSFDDFLKSNRRVTRYKDTFIKKGTWEGLNEEAKIQNIVANEFFYYPTATVVKKGDRSFLITAEVKGETLYKPISELAPFQKITLAKVTRFLWKKGYIDFDLRKDNIVIDKKKRPVMIDFDKVIPLSDKKNTEMQYNLNILSIFGFRDRRANQFLTMTLKELGLR